MLALVGAEITSARSEDGSYTQAFHFVN